MLEASLESYASAPERLPERRCVCRDTDPPRHTLTSSATDRGGLVLAAFAVRNAVRPRSLNQPRDTGRCLKRSEFRYGQRETDAQIMAVSGMTDRNRATDHNSPTLVALSRGIS